jgi:hypothetical protein
VIFAERELTVRHGKLAETDIETIRGKITTVQNGVASIQTLLKTMNVTGNSIKTAGLQTRTL